MNLNRRANHRLREFVCIRIRFPSHPSPILASLASWRFRYEVLCHDLYAIPVAESRSFAVEALGETALGQELFP